MIAGLILLAVSGAAAAAYAWYKSHQLWMDDHPVASISLLLLGFAAVINTALAIARTLNGS